MDMDDLQSADFAREADEVMYSERDRLRTSLLSSVTVLQIHHALGIYSNWLQARVRLHSPSCWSSWQANRCLQRICGCRQWHYLHWLDWSHMPAACMSCCERCCQGIMEHSLCEAAAASKFCTDRLLTLQRNVGTATLRTNCCSGRLLLRTLPELLWRQASVPHSRDCDPAGPTRGLTQNGLRQAADDMLEVAELEASQLPPEWVARSYAQPLALKQAAQLRAAYVSCTSWLSLDSPT
jgi:hypothetical protein